MKQVVEKTKTRCWPGVPPLFGLVLAASMAISIQAQFAESVVAYDPGIGFATDFGTGAGLTNAPSALGVPSRVTPGAFGGVVTPFGPPFLASQIVSIGDGGSLTVELSDPVHDAEDHPFGIDLIVYGNAGFVITNGNFTGGGITDGTLFGADEGELRVSVSEDGAAYFPLSAPAGTLQPWEAPTFGDGDFHRPLDPAVRTGTFAGQDLSGILGLYGGSAGGMGFDLAWAQDGLGQSVALSAIRFVRLEALGGKFDVDAVSGVRSGVELGESLAETFAMNPFNDGWAVHGDASLFSWDEAGGHMNVTWDSSRPNSFFYRPIQPLSRRAAFALEFDLELEEMAVGVSPNAPGAFQIAVGLIHRADAFGEGYLRGTGANSPNLVEFNYFADAGFGATISPVVVSDQSRFAAEFVFPVELHLGIRYRISMRYDDPSTGTLQLRVIRRGAPAGSSSLDDEEIAARSLTLPEGFGEFMVDAVAVSSYSGAGQTPPEFAGSVLAMGRVDNLILERVSAIPGDAVSLEGRWAGAKWQVLARDLADHPSASAARLEVSSDLTAWTPVGDSGVSWGSHRLFTDSDASGPGHRFYRLRTVAEGNP